MKPRPSGWIFAGLLLAGVAVFAALGALVGGTLGKVFTGTGLDTYHAFWRLEFGHIGSLALVACGLLVLVVGLIVYRHGRQRHRKREQDSRPG